MLRIVTNELQVGQRKVERHSLLLDQRKRLHKAEGLALEEDTLFTLRMKRISPDGSVLLFEQPDGV